MLGRRLQVLAHGQEVDVGGAQVVHDLQDLLARLAEPDHHAGLGEHRWLDLFHARQQAQRREVAGTRPYGWIKPRHGLEIVVEHVRPCGDHGLDRSVLAHEVRSQHFDRGLGRRLMQSGDHRREVPCSTIAKIVPVDRGHHDMAEAEPTHGFGDVARLVRIEGTRLAGGDVAEGTGARAGVAHDHEGGVLVLPALADIRASRLLAYGGEAILAHQPLGLGILR